MDTIYVITIDSENYENEPVSITSNIEAAADLVEMYYRNWEDNGYTRLVDVTYTINEVPLDENKKVLWEHV